MIIHLRPSLGPGVLTLARQGETLVINGVEIDFAVVPDGAVVSAEAIASDAVTEPARRIGGQMNVAILMPIGYDASEAARFPAPIVNPADGPISLPE